MSGVAEYVAEASGLGSLPGAYGLLSEVLADPSSDAKAIARAVTCDPALAARLLRLVNSAAYGIRSPVDTVSRAATLIGTAELRHLALATSVVHMFRGMPEHLMDMRSFWEHSVATGLCARLLALSAGVTSAENMFIAGLLHNIGTLSLCLRHPDIARRALVMQENDGVSLHDAERAQLGFDHADIGGALLESWGLPELPVACARMHHRLRGVAEHPQRLGIAAVHAADVLVSRWNLGSSGQRHRLAMDPWAGALLKLEEEPKGIADEVRADLAVAVEALI